MELYKLFDPFMTYQEKNSSFIGIYLHVNSPRIFEIQSDTRTNRYHLHGEEFQNFFSGYERTIVSPK